MRSLLFGVLIAGLFACGSSTAPKGGAGDPSLLFNNETGSWVFVTWRDGVAVEGRDSVPPHTPSQCVRFLAQPDSAYWDIKINDPIGGSAEVTAPYFNPADRPAWTVNVSSSPNGTILHADLTATPC